jgi:dihydrofolate reductase
MRSSLSLIVAVADNDVIGVAGGLPWDYPEDRAYFDETTRGHVVIMGRRTWEETRAPLPGRDNVVVSRTLGEAPGAVVLPSLGDALAYAAPRDPAPFVIGGVRLFEEAMPEVTRVYITRIPESPAGDTRFAFDSAPFRLVSERLGDGGARFQVWERLHAAAGAHE